MFDIKIVIINQTKYIAVFYENEWYAKACVKPDGTAIPGDEYDKLGDDAVSKAILAKLPKLPSFIKLLTDTNGA
jgi:hypothetical protein